MYNQLTIHQRISLKAIIISKNERRAIGIKDDTPFEALRGLKLFYPWKTVINYFFSNDINELT